MSAIVTPDLLGRFIITTLTFEDLASLEGQELGVANNPYACIGLTFSNAVVDRDARIHSDSRGVALKSKRSTRQNDQHEINLRFAKPHGGFGFFFRAGQLSRLAVTVLDSHETLIEEDVFHAEEGYAGVIRARAEMEIVRIMAKIEHPDTAENFHFYIDDFTFGRELKGSY